MGKLPKYVQYFGPNIVEDVAESWVLAEMSWMEVEMSWWRWMELGARFSKPLFRPLGLQLYLKETPTQLFSCEFCENFKNTFFEEHLQTAAPVICII